MLPAHPPTGVVPLAVRTVYRCAQWVLRLKGLADEHAANAEVPSSRAATASALLVRPRDARLATFLDVRRRRLVPGRRCYSELSISSFGGDAN
jgi:hypothetical protein